MSSVFYVIVLYGLCYHKLILMQFLWAERIGVMMTIMLGPLGVELIHPTL